MIPWNVFQTQGDRTSNRIGGHHVEVGEVGNDLKQRSNLDVLEVERELFAVVARALGQLAGIDLLLANFEHKLVVTLVCGMLPIARWRHHHANTVARLGSGHALHRRAEIADIEAAAQAFGQRCLEKLDHQVLALLANIDAHLVVGQLDDHAACVAHAAAEIDVAER